MHLKMRWQHLSRNSKPIWDYMKEKDLREFNVLEILFFHVQVNLNR